MIIPNFNEKMVSQKTPLIVCVGAYERHNFGDILMPKIIAKKLPDHDIIFSSTVSADLTSMGGDVVYSYEEAATIAGERAVRIIYVGGETLTCSLAAGLLMCMSSAEAHEYLQMFHRDGELAKALANLACHHNSPFAYVLSPEIFRNVASISFHAVGFSHPASLPEDMAHYLRDVFAKTSFIGIRDRAGSAWLNDQGISTTSMPCGVSCLSRELDEMVRERLNHPPMQQVLKQAAGGYFACQARADIVDEHIDSLVAQVKNVYQTTGFPSVWFAAGIAYSHDSLALLKILCERSEGAAILMDSLNIWDACCLIKHSKGYCGSSLHGRIVACSYAIPRRNYTPQAPKITEYATLWDAFPNSIFSDVSAWQSNMLDMLRDDVAELVRIQQECITQHDLAWSAMLESWTTSTLPRLAEASQPSLQRPLDSLSKVVKHLERSNLMKIGEQQAIQQSYEKQVNALKVEVASNQEHMGMLKGQVNLLGQQIDELNARAESNLIEWQKNQSQHQQKVLALRKQIDELKAEKKSDRLKNRALRKLISKWNEQFWFKRALHKMRLPADL